MKLKILRGKGGIGRNLRVTSMLLDNNILTGAGIGAGKLSLRQLVRINQVFVIGFLFE